MSATTPYTVVQASLASDVKFSPRPFSSVLSKAAPTGWKKNIKNRILQVRPSANTFHERSWFSAELVVEANRLLKNISKLKECQKRILTVGINSSFVLVNVYALVRLKQQQQKRNIIKQKT